jgi:DNA-binding transcriptional MerR regulator
MAYTVKKLAELSKVSVRTLHFYDQIGLLSPAYVGDQGYRYYEKEELLTLQQILFFRELGFELKEIQTILNQSDFDKLKALARHRYALMQKKLRMEELTRTIDQTIEKIRGENNMKDNEMYQGFSPEKQASYEEYLVNRYGDKVKKHVAEAKANAAEWSDAKKKANAADWDAICEDLLSAMMRGEDVKSDAVQTIVAKHYSWIKQFWTPNHDSYVGLGLGYTAFEWEQAFVKYDDEHPRLAEFMAKAMEVFADKHL